MKKILVLVGFVVILVIFSVTTDRIAKDSVHKRVIYWERLIDAELPIGTQKEIVGQWIKQKNLNLQRDANNSFWGDVEEVHYIGNPIPCGNSQSIRVELEFGSDGKYIGRKVHPIARCM